MLTKNLLLKTTALLAAVVIWLLFILNGIQKREVAIPVKLNNLPEDLIPAGDSPKTVSVRVEGRGIDLLRQRLTNAAYMVDASGFRYGENTVDLDRKNLVMAGRATDFAGNSRITLIMDWIRQQKKPIEVKYATTKDRQFFNAGGYRADPLMITVRGPEKLLSKIDKITTAPVSKGMLKDKRVELTLNPIEGIEIVTVSAVLSTAPSSLERRTIPLIAILQPMSSAYDIVPKNVTVVVEGKADAVQVLLPGDIVVRPLSTPVRDGELLDLTFETPPGVQVVDYTPQKVQAIRHDTNSRR